MNAKKNSKEKLPRQVKALGLVSFFNDSASEMIVPLLPLFVTQTLGLGPQILGVMEGIAEAVAALLKYFSGWWSDRLQRRKPLAVAGYVLASATRPLFGLITAGWHLVTLRGLDRVGKGLRTAPRDVLLAESVRPDMRGRAFGFHRAMDHAGAVVGPLIAFALLYGLQLDLRTIFLLAAVPSLLTIAFVVFAVKEVVPKREVSKEADESSQPETTKQERRQFGVFLVAMILFTLGNSTDVFLILHAHELGVPDYLAPIMWVVLHLSKTIWATPCGGLSDRFGRVPVILAGWMLYAVVYFLFASSQAAWQVWPLFVLYGLYYGLTEGPEKALTADLVKSRQRGKGFGAYHLAIGVSALPASVMAGFLWQQYGASVALGLGAACAALAAIVLAFAFLRTPFQTNKAN